MKLRKTNEDVFMPMLSLDMARRWFARRYLLRSLSRFFFLAVLVSANCLAKDLVVGVYDNEPKIFFDQNHKPAGIHIDIINKIAEEEHWHLHFVACQWQACLHGLQTGEIDLMPDVAYSEERQALYDFNSVPALYGWSILYRNRHVQINSLFDLNNKRVAILAGSIQEAYLKQLLENSNIHIIFVEVKTVQEAFELVAEDKADGVVATEQVGDLLAARYGVVDTPIVFQPIKVFFTSGKGRNADVLAAIDTHLAAWQADPGSVYFDILHKWGPGKQSRLPKFILWGLGITIVLCLAAFAIAAYLRREVALRTKELRFSEQSLRIAATVFQSQEAMWVMESSKQVLNVNEAFVKLTGYRLEELPQGRIAPMYLENQTQDYRDQIWSDVQKTGQAQAEVETRKKTGESYMARLTLTAVRDREYHVTHYVGTQTDITQQKLLQQETARLAYYDPLTGLPNRQLLVKRVQQIILANTDDSKTNALLVIDLDNFKDLNDTLGHDIGDQFLLQVSRRLQAMSGMPELVCRLGGDEFVVLLSGIRKEEAEATVRLAAQKILVLVADRFDLSGISYQTTCSIGGTFFDANQTSVQDILRRGDLAMYQAKRNGRNTFCLFLADMENAVSFRTALEADLRSVLDQRQLFLHYQPQVDFQGKITGVEALLRWRHPVRGLVSPSIFIPVAEAAGLISSIGRWVLLQACRQAAQWKKERPELVLMIAVNVSALQFRHPEFIAYVSQIIAETGVDPSCLKLELTETMMVEDVEDTIEKMSILKAYGISFSLDDFGVGYSSLSLLKRLPIDQLKIDHSFVKDILTDANDVAIAKSIIALGSALNLAIIAEGVETVAQRDFLAELGCHNYQGYLFGHPVAPEELPL